MGKLSTLSSLRRMKFLGFAIIAVTTIVAMTLGSSKCLTSSGGRYSFWKTPLVCPPSLNFRQGQRTVCNVSFADNGIATFETDPRVIGDYGGDSFLPGNQKVLCEHLYGWCDRWDGAQQICRVLNYEELMELHRHQIVTWGKNCSIKAQATVGGIVGWCREWQGQRGTSIRVKQLGCPHSWKKVDHRVGVGNVFAVSELLWWPYEPLATSLITDDFRRIAWFLCSVQSVWRDLPYSRLVNHVA